MIHFAFDQTRLVVMIVLSIAANQFQTAQRDETGMKVLVEQRRIMVREFFATDEFVGFSRQIEFRVQSNVADRFEQHGMRTQR